jgi:hypothetical protein
MLLTKETGLDFSPLSLLLRAKRGNPATLHRDCFGWLKPAWQKQEGEHARGNGKMRRLL